MSKTAGKNLTALLMPRVVCILLASTSHPICPQHHIFNADRLQEQELMGPAELSDSAQKSERQQSTHSGSPYAHPGSTQRLHALDK